MNTNEFKNGVGNLISKANGQLKFTEDLKVPGMLYGIGVYSSISSGNIIDINIEEAINVPGVKKVLLAKDIPGKNLLYTDDLSHPIISEEVNYTGDAIAIIAAETEEAARKAAKLVRVKYDEKPGIYTIDDAISNPNLVITHLNHKQGNIEEGFAKADVIVEGTFDTPIVDHAYLERESALAIPEPDGRMTIYGGSQEPYNVPTVVSRVLNCPREQIRFMGMGIGGAFGGKSETAFIVACRAALLAWYCKLPVKFIVSREESIRSSTKRNSARLYYKMGANKEGYITSMEARVYLDKGPYLGNVERLPASLNRIYWHYTGPYNIPNTSLDAYLLRTNNTYGGQVRSPGVPKACFAVETQMDQLAEALNMDPLEFRLKNALEAGMTTANGVYLKDSVGIKKTLHEASRLMKLRDFKNDKSNAKKVKGVGMASFWHGISYAHERDTAEAHIFLQSDGTFLVRTGLVEMGQGLQTVLGKVASSELDVPENLVSVTDPNSDIDPDSKTSTSSRATVVGSLAIRIAAQEARKYIINQASRFSGLDVSRLYWKSGTIYSSDGSWSMDISNIASKIGSERPLLVGSGKWQRKLGSKGYTAYGYATQVAEVEVDTETGFVKLLRAILIQDVGKVLNHKLLEGQVVGGALMAVGYGLSEEIMLDKGKILNPNFHDYRIPLFTDSPQVECIFVEDPCSEFVFGAKGAGEPPTVPMAAAIANAYYNATGLRAYQLPIMQENLTCNFPQKINIVEEEL